MDPCSFFGSNGHKCGQKKCMGRLRNRGTIYDREHADLRSARNNPFKCFDFGIMSYLPYFRYEESIFDISFSQRAT